MLGHGEEEECEHEHSRTPPNSRGYRRRGCVRDDEASIQVEMMQDLQRSKRPLFDGQGIGLKARTWLLDMGNFFS